jgi:hypothetical protein
MRTNPDGQVFSTIKTCIVFAATSQRQGLQCAYQKYRYTMLFIEYMVDRRTDQYHIRAKRRP